MFRTINRGRRVDTSRPTGNATARAAANQLSSFQIKGTSGLATSRALVAGALIGLGTLAGVPAALAQTPSTPTPTNDTSLTWHGITLSGSVDLGLQYQPNAAPISDYYGAGGYNLVQADSLHSETAVTPNNLSQSNIALTGIEPIVGNLSGVFQVQSLFLPTSGNLLDGLKSLTLNNGKAAAAQTNGQDSDIDGQLFGGAAYVGLSDPALGTVTFGWQTTLLSDGAISYDPNAGSYAFSLVGQSGTVRGGGDTEDKRLKNSLKYVLKTDNVHVGVLYKFSDAGSGTASSAYQFQLGGTYAGLSLDAYYSKIYDAIAAASLNATQVGELPTLGYSPSNSVAGTISDNTAYALLGSYVIGPAKVFAAYERVQFANPSTPLPAGTATLGGYILAIISNTKYTSDKDQNIYWAGVKWSATPSLDVTAAAYRYQADSYQSGTTAPCGTSAHGNCSGTETAASLDAVYHFSKRFDGYAGAMYSTVSDGLAAGFVNTYTINPTVGFRFKF
jgi:predicted porin